MNTADGRSNTDIFLQSHAGRPVRVDRGGRTVVMAKPALAIGDALAMTLLVAKGFRQEDFASLHPGGKLGQDSPQPAAIAGMPGRHRCRRQMSIAPPI